MTFEKEKIQCVKRQGAILVIVLVMIVAMLTLSAFCIGVSQIQLAKTEVQIVADCSSLSATTMIGEEDNHTGTYNTPTEVAKYVPTRNTIMGVTASVNDDDVVLGNARMGSNGQMVFTPNMLPQNAVKVSVGLGGSSSMQAQSLLFPFQMSRTTFALRKESISAKLEHDICVVLDRSGSMSESKYPGGSYPYHPWWDRPAPSNMPYPWNYYAAWGWYPIYFAHPTDSRWGAVVGAIDPLVDSLNQTPMSEQCSLVTFGTATDAWGISYNAADTTAEPTQDYSNFSTTLADLGESRPMWGGTQISAGMEMAIDILTGPQSRDHAYKTMVVLTDGVENSGSNAVYTAGLAASSGITVHTVTFASSSGFQTMQATATAGGGNAFWAPDEDALREIFADIGSAPPVAIIE